MPRLHIGIAAISDQRFEIEERERNRNQTASESVEKRVVTTEIAVIRIAAISNRKRVGFEIASDWASKHDPSELGLLLFEVV